MSLDPQAVLDEAVRETHEALSRAVSSRADAARYPASDHHYSVAADNKRAAGISIDRAVRVARLVGRLEGREDACAQCDIAPCWECKAERNRLLRELEREVKG